MSAIVIAGLDFAWPDGSFVFGGLDTVLGAGRTGLVGVNGSGKSTLLRLIAGELTPAAGTISVTGRLGYLPQNLVLDARRRVDEVLGIVDVRAAIAAIEAGDTDERHFAVVGDRWDVEERTRATLDQLGLGHVSVTRHVGELSGGEVVLLGLAAQILREPDVLLLDEPTNNLDQRARGLVYETVRSWKGVLVIVSHDRELLRLVDRIGDLREGEIAYYGGNIDDYEAALAAEQEAAERALRAAESDVRRQKRELIEAQTKLARRRRYGQKMFDQKREPKVRMRKRAEDAEIAAGKYRNLHIDRLDQAMDRLKAAEDGVRQDDEIRVDLPATAVPQEREVLRLSEVELRNGALADLDVRGPERIALVGDNGAGKTTLLRTVLGDLPPVAGEVTLHVPARWLPQRLDVLDDELSAVDNVARAAPSASNNTIRARLARFLLRGTRADQLAGTLSGGERFRATLATLLLAEPAPQLLLLDEPTNNLDLASVRQLGQSLAAYSGALVVASHDLPFLRTIGVTRWLRLDGRLTEIDPCESSRPRL
ncbi:ABC-F family ATP-binding cassette domain-containing protein [Amycolatopsis suaedae]|uniref:ABC-F family ATP-binding cassette domain-containing protein n=1 Tax=Amycolatopsis suaedae TaxID=2510978 RepID=A0A4Q7J726_9PSEU|nr:ATP-binding cassette domain-containing protein [Amycolatopsis suaedae]RZQ63460.1 ABC-F family ATP-binding cassette domain-containing protein [Amycolatopsis suaedae]